MEKKSQREKSVFVMWLKIEIRTMMLLLKRKAVNTFSIDKYINYNISKIQRKLSENNGDIKNLI